jgi:hypothetical protein
LSPSRRGLESATPHVLIGFWRFNQINRCTSIGSQFAIARVDSSPGRFRLTGQVALLTGGAMTEVFVNGMLVMPRQIPVFLAIASSLRASQ